MTKIAAVAGALNPSENSPVTTTWSWRGLLGGLSVLAWLPIAGGQDSESNCNTTTTLSYVTAVTVGVALASTLGSCISAAVCILQARSIRKLREQNAILEQANMEITDRLRGLRREHTELRRASFSRQPPESAEQKRIVSFQLIEEGNEVDPPANSRF